MTSVRIRALFFASYRDMAGSEEISVDLAPESSVVDLVAQLRSRGREWQGLPPSPAVAVNRVYASLDTPLRDGDEVAFIPPVSGG